MLSRKKIVIRTYQFTRDISPDQLKEKEKLMAVLTEILTFIFWQNVDSTV